MSKEPLDLEAMVLKALRTCVICGKPVKNGNRQTRTCSPFCTSEFKGRPLEKEFHYLLARDATILEMAKAAGASMVKPCPFSDAYHICDNGVVISHGHGRPIIKKAQFNKYGYKCYSLWKDCRAQTFFCHTLVLLTFVGPRPSPDHVTRHLDGNKLNNHVSNLAWGTKDENEMDKVLHKSCAGERNWKAKLTSEKVIELRRRFYAGEPARNLASEFSINLTYVHSVASGRSWRHLPFGDQLLNESPRNRYEC